MGSPPHRSCKKCGSSKLHLGMGAVPLGLGMCDKGCPSSLGVCPVLGSLLQLPPHPWPAGRVVGAPMEWLQGKVPSGGQFPTADPCHRISPSHGGTFLPQDISDQTRGHQDFTGLCCLSKPPGSLWLFPWLSGHGKPRPKGMEKTQHWNPSCCQIPQRCQKWICSILVADLIPRSQEPLKFVTKYLLLGALMDSKMKINRGVCRKCSCFLQRDFPGHRRSRFGVEKWFTSLQNRDCPCINRHLNLASQRGKLTYSGQNITSLKLLGLCQQLKPQIIYPENTKSTRSGTVGTATVE